MKNFRKNIVLLRQYYRSKQVYELTTIYCNIIDGLNSDIEGYPVYIANEVRQAISEMRELQLRATHCCSYFTKSQIEDEIHQFNKIANHLAYDVFIPWLTQLTCKNKGELD